MPCYFPSDPDNLAAKIALRAAMQEKRQKLDPKARRQAATKLAERVPALLKQYLKAAPRPLHIAVYAAIRGEIDLAPLFPFLRALPATLYFPKILQGQLFFLPLAATIKPGDWLVPGLFDVPEPPDTDDAAAAKADALDLIFVPGLAFDRDGHRLGWGKGYYDRALCGRQHPLAVGVGYDFQLTCQTLPAEGHDEKLDVLLTPGGCLEFS